MLNAIAAASRCGMVWRMKTLNVAINALGTIGLMDRDNHAFIMDVGVKPIQ